MTLHKGHTAQDQAMYLRHLQEENKILREIAEAASDYKRELDDAINTEDFIEADSKRSYLFMLSEAWEEELNENNS